VENDGNEEVLDDTDLQWEEEDYSNEIEVNELSDDDLEDQREEDIHNEGIITFLMKPYNNKYHNN
jgi:hypothetical protein